MEEKEAVTPQTKWQCQKCGKCCENIINVREKCLSIIRNSKIMCRFFDPVLKECTNYTKRPLICKIYPFYIDMKDKSVFEAIRPENLRLDKKCLGLGQGKKVHNNMKLQKHMEDIASQVLKLSRKAVKSGKDLKKFI